MIEHFLMECAQTRGAVTIEWFYWIKKFKDPLILFADPNSIKLNKPLMEVTKSGSKWTDCIYCKYSGFPMLFSERVIKKIKEEGLHGIRYGEVDFDLRANKKLNDAPKYYWVMPEGEPPKILYKVYEAIDTRLSEPKDGWRSERRFEYRFETLDRDNDERCHSITEGFFQHYKKVPLEPFSQGLGFMPYSKHDHGMVCFGGFYCSRRFVELAREQNWSNFNFEPIDSISKRFIDFRKLPWPPELWYGKNQPMD